MDSGSVPGRTSSLLEVSCEIRNNVGANARERARARKREDNLSRPRSMEFLLSASRNSYLRFRDSSLSLPIFCSRHESCYGIVTIFPKIPYIWTRLTTPTLPKCLKNIVHNIYRAKKINFSEYNEWKYARWEICTDENEISENTKTIRFLRTLFPQIEANNIVVSCFHCVSHGKWGWRNRLLYIPH